MRTALFLASILSIYFTNAVAWTFATAVTYRMMAAQHHRVIHSAPAPQQQLGERNRHSMKLSTLPIEYENMSLVARDASISLSMSENSSSNEMEGGLMSDTSKISMSNNVNILQKIKSYFVPKSDGLTARERLAKMGLAAVLSYGWVSNMSYSVTVSVAWYIFSSQTKKSPLAPGQWKGFLAVYAGFWVFNNIIRPVRVGVAVAISPQFDRFVLNLQERLNVSKAIAVTVTVILANLIGTLLVMSAGILLAAFLAGVPVFPART